MTLGANDLVLTSSTLGNPPFPELLAAAAGAGFAGLSLWPGADYAPARAQGMSDRELRARLDDAGLVVNDVDSIVTWVGPGDPGPPYFQEPEPELLWAAADALGATYVNVLLIGARDVPEDDVVAAMAEVCDTALDHGLVATLELARGTQARDLAAATRIATATGRPNAAVLLDAWHAHWGRTTLDDIRRAPPGAIGAVQLNDGPTERPADYAHATRWARLAPGDGTFDLAGLIEALDTAGYDGPLSVEVFNQELVDQLGSAGMAAKVADGARRLRPRRAEGDTDRGAR